MSDTVSKEKRSEIMSHVTGKETKPEIMVRKYLFALGLRYRKNVKQLPGTPDIVFPKYKTAVFVNGCFWHGHKECKYCFSNSLAFTSQFTIFLHQSRHC